jgi:hypothetical protein
MGTMTVWRRFRRSSHSGEVNRAGRYWADEELADGAASGTDRKATHSSASSVLSAA